MLKYVLTSAVALTVCVTMEGCGGGKSDGVISVSSDELSFHADLYGGRPNSQTIRLKAEQKEVELPSIFYDTNFISGVTTTALNSAIIDAHVHVVTPQSLGAGNYTTNLNIVSSQFQKDVKITYTINDSTINLQADKRVDTISPYVAVYGNTGEYILRGKGFSSFDSNNPPLITVGTYEVTDYTYVNDKEIKIVLPSLASGSHQVKVHHSSGEYSSVSSLEVVEPFVFGNAEISSEGKRSIIYDDKRKSIIALNTTLSSIERFSYSNDETWLVESLVIPDIVKARIAPDGDTLVILKRNGVIKIDLDNPVLVIKSIIDFPEHITTYMSHMASCNSGLMVLGSYSNRSELVVYNIFTDKIYTEFNLERKYFASPLLISHKNGSQVVIKETEGRFHVMNCNSYELKQVNYDYTLNQASMAAASDHSLFLLAGKDIYNSSYKYLSSLPESSSISIFSPDNSKLYTFDATTKTIRSYDLTNTSSPQKVGEISIEVSNWMAYTTTISKDGNTLFFASYDKIHVINLNSPSFIP